ncbi:cupin domain-containing protein [Natronosalvus halobius]|nr:cupin domain-containing protein [Natronosalvus halobius]USZ70414.1 cupin domain-containing protein [Natronosalvus halobius]
MGSLAVNGEEDVTGYDATSYEDVEPRAPGMSFLRDALDCETHGLTVIEADEGWDGLEHDHEDDGQEEVYLLIEGEATIQIDGDQVDLASGDAVRVDPETTRELRFTADDSLMVVTGAP